MRPRAEPGLTSYLLVVQAVAGSNPVAHPSLQCGFPGFLSAWGNGLGNVRSGRSNDLRYPRPGEVTPRPMAPAPTYQLRHLSDDGTKSAPFSEAYDSPSALGGFVGYLLQQIRALR